jgi:hypothetical protein
MIHKDIEIHREYVLNNNCGTIHFVVRTRLYDNSVQYWLDLVEIAKQDFPDLNLKEVETIVYGGDSIRKTRGIEFTLKRPVEIPQGYFEICSLISTLG